MLETADKVISAVKALRDIAKRIENAELRNKLADLMVDTADLKMELTELKSKNIALRDENDALKRRADLRSKMSVTDRALYLTEQIVGYDQGPFCPICFETDGILINVWKTGCGGWHCPHCQKTP